MTWTCRTLFFWTALAFASTLPGCSRSHTATGPNPMEARRIPAELQEDLDPVVEGNTAFAIDLYQRLRGEEGNLFLSPYSISTALAMTWAGARGVTENEMARTLHFTLSQDRLHPIFGALQRSLDTGTGFGGYRLNIANRLWGRQGYAWRDSFLQITRASYGAELQPLDFENEPEGSRQTINRWVEEKTVGKIPELLPQGTISSMTMLVLTNAIYFKGSWASRFDESATHPGSFRVPPDRVVQVPIMRQEAVFGYGETPELQVLEMRYKGEDLAMVFLLPRQADGLAGLEAGLTPARLTGWLALVEPGEVDVRLPRFRVTFDVSLGETLAAMGMPSAFGLGAADFSGLDGTRSLYISKVIHKAFVEVNEEGTEAAGATGVIIDRTSLTPVFNADHPFLFLIRDRVTGSILFLGRVADPSA